MFSFFFKKHPFNNKLFGKQGLLILSYECEAEKKQANASYPDFAF